MAFFRCSSGGGGGGSLSIGYVTGTWYGSAPNYLTIPTTKKAKGFFLTVLYSNEVYFYACADENSVIQRNGTNWTPGGVGAMAQFNNNNIFVPLTFSDNRNFSYQCYVLYTE